MWQKLKSLIKKLFNKTVVEVEDEKSEEYVSQYRDETLNLTAIAANKLATFVVTESNVDVGKGEDEDDPRISFLNNFIQKVWAKSKKITAQAFGTGGVVLVPYCVNENLYFDIVGQNRMGIISTLGDVITEAVFLSDAISRKKTSYCRLTYYEITEKGCYIRNRAIKDTTTEISLKKVPEWADIDPEIFIPNCKKVPVAYIKCPIDNRRSDDLKGVPITFGCNTIIAEITDCLNQIRDEYVKKKPIIFADTTLFDKEEKVDKTLYKTFSGGKLGEGSLIDIFDPQIRDGAYYNRLESLYEILEKSMGTSKGIFSEPVTNYATATEIKRSIYDTFAIVENTRKAWERTMQDMLDAAIVICDFYGLVPYSTEKVPLKFDWSYGLVESSEITYQQYSEGNARGVIADAEYRQFIKPKETLAEAQRAVDEIRKSEPKVEDIIDDTETTITEAS